MTELLQALASASRMRPISCRFLSGMMRRRRRRRRRRRMMMRMMAMMMMMAMAAAVQWQVHPKHSVNFHSEFDVYLIQTT